MKAQNQPSTVKNQATQTKSSRKRKRKSTVKPAESLRITVVWGQRKKRRRTKKKWGQAMRRVALA